MTDSERDRHRKEAEAYMRNCTERQLENIIQDETMRMTQGGEVGIVAEIMMRAARREIYRRWSN